MRSPLAFFREVWSKALSVEQLQRVENRVAIRKAMGATDLFPFVTTDEDGDFAYAMGHHDDTEMMSALYYWADRDGWLDELDSLNWEEGRRSISRAWLRDPGADSDYAVECGKWDPDAKPFTRMDI